MQPPRNEPTVSMPIGEANGLRPPPLIYAPPQDPFLDILHVDDELLFVAKPSGLLSVPGRGPALADCVAARATVLYPEARVVHRLDLETSGVMVMARSRAAQRGIGRQFEDRTVGKVYIARVAGRMRADHGTVDAPLICDWPNRPRQIIDRTLGKPALTRWQVMTREIDATRVRLMPVSGRAHQLRVHMASIGHPILADSLYAHASARRAAERLQLHAQSLTLRHPSDGAWLTIEHPCPF